MTWVLVVIWTLGGSYRSPSHFADERACMRQAALAMRGASQGYDTNASVRAAFCEPAPAKDSH